VCVCVCVSQCSRGKHDAQRVATTSAQRAAGPHGNALNSVVHHRLCGEGERTITNVSTGSDAFCAMDAVALDWHTDLVEEIKCVHDRHLKVVELEPFLPHLLAVRYRLVRVHICVRLSHARRSLALCSSNTHSGAKCKVTRRVSDQTSE
jgi:hypothetical protein